MDDTALQLGSKASSKATAESKKLEANCEEQITQLKESQPHTETLDSFQQSTETQCNVCRGLYNCQARAYSSPCEAVTVHPKLRRSMCGMILMLSL